MTDGPVIIAGVGRSGTTAAFELMDGWYSKTGRDKARVYEPYVWESAALFRNGKLNPDGFTTQAYSARGVLTHLETPLFLAESDATHDRFVRGLTCGKSRDGVIKMIRGCGRLEAYSRLYPDSKIIAVVRNPFDSLNSAHLHFSLLGDEFHLSDKRRLFREISERFGDDIEGPSRRDEKEHVWAAYWWLYMNRAMTDHYAAHPDHVMILPYELLLENESTAIDRIAGFLGLDPADAPSVTQGRARTGVTSKANRVLTEEETGFLESFQTWYEDFLLAPAQVETLVSDRYKLVGLKDHYSKTTGESLLRKYPTWRTSVGWRFAFDGRVGHRNASLEERLASLENDAALLNRLSGRPGLAQLDNLEARRAERGNRAPRFAPRISCIISIHDEDEETLRQSVGSVLNQTLQPFEIILANDASGAETSEIAGAIADSYKNVRHLRHSANLGPGANRHVATLAAQGDWVTHLDADDRWLPRKLEAEWAAINTVNDPYTAVAVSNVQIYEDSEYDHGWDMAAFASRPKYQQVAYMLRRDGPIPRDMLMAKALYRSSGGFETYARQYEDWSFKLRLIRRSNEWVSSHEDGIVYQRTKDSGLSSGSASAHLYWRWFALCRNAELESDYQSLLIEAFENAIKLLPPYEWLHKLMTIALASARDSENAYARLLSAADVLVSRVNLDRAKGNYAEELERFAHAIIEPGTRHNRVRKLKLVRTR